MAALKMLDLGDDPVAQLSAVAGAFDAQAVAIDPEIAAQRRAHAVEDILRFVAVLIGEYGVGEFLSIACGAAIIHHQRGPAVRGIDLVAEIERGALLAVRAAVDIHDERIFAIGAETGGIGEERFDSPLVVAADEGERFHRLRGLAGQSLSVQIGQLLGWAVAGFQIQLRQIAGRSKRVGDLIAVH